MKQQITQEMWDELNEKYEKLRISEEIYRVAMGLTDHIVSVVDIPNRTTLQVHNEGIWSTLTSKMPNAPESIIDTGIIHPDDQEEFRRYYRDMYSGMDETECIIRSKDDNRGWLWFHVYSKMVYDEDGKPLRAIAFSDDITSKKNSEFQYQQYKSVVTANADYVWEANLTLNTMISEDSNFDALFDHHKNQKYSEIHKIGTNLIVNEDQREYVDANFSREGLLEHFADAKRELKYDYQIDFHDGKGVRWVHMVAHMMTNMKGEIVVIICSSDISSIQREIELLEYKSQHDELTGLVNRSALISGVEKIMQETPSDLHGFMIFDIDSFKTCNDSFGHAYGDEILRYTADVMRSTFRSSDILCRLGGDEFVVCLLTATDQKIVEQKGNDLITALDKYSKEHNLDFAIHISIGATINKPGETFQDIYLRMDKALYESKRNGKNQLTFA